MAKTTTWVSVKRTERGWQFQPVAANGEPGGTSEPYTTEANCVRAARRWHPEAPIRVRRHEGKGVISLRSGVDLQRGRR